MGGGMDEGVPVDEVEEVGGTGYGRAMNSWPRFWTLSQGKWGLSRGKIVIVTLQTWKLRLQEVTGLVRGSSVSQGQSLEKDPAVPDFGTSWSFS